MMTIKMITSPLDDNDDDNIDDDHMDNDDDDDDEGDNLTLCASIWEMT